MLLGETPEDYDKHFILTADIDLDPNLPGRRVFERAIIACDSDPVEPYYQGPPFTGVFDGNGHMISHVTITGNAYLGLFGYFGSGGRISSLGLEAIDVNGIGDLLGGLTGINDGSITSCYSTGTVNGMNRVGGLVGYNRSMITASYSTGSVSGDSYIGGLVGWNEDSITTSYSTATVSGSQRIGGLMGTSFGGGGGVHGSIKNCYSTGIVGGDLYVGGLVGENVGGSITNCYSTGMVNGTGDYVSGLVGDNYWWGTVTECFWDMTTSEQTTSDGGTGKTTAEMQKVSTFLDAGWDFVGETDNGTEDIWSICEGTNYPRFVWQIPIGDFVCPDGVTIEDFAFFMEHWLDDNCDLSNGYCEGTDLDQSGTVDINDLEILFENWLVKN